MAFKSAFNASELKGSVRATLLGRYYALRVINACMTTYVDENGDKVSTNVLSATTQALILTLGLVCDYKALMEALGESSDGVTVANVKERFKSLYSDWQEQVRLEASVDGSDVQSKFDAYVKAFDGHVSEMGDAVITLLGKETSYKQGKAIPLAGNMGLPRIQATETIEVTDKNGKTKKTVRKLVDKFGKPLMVYPTEPLWDKIPRSEQSAAFAAARFTEVKGSLLVGLKASVSGVVIKAD